MCPPAAVGICGSKNRVGPRDEGPRLQVGTWQSLAGPVADVQTGLPPTTLVQRARTVVSVGLLTMTA